MSIKLRVKVLRVKAYLKSEKVGEPFGSSSEEGRVAGCEKG
jgi:hypothetical protein